MMKTSVSTSSHMLVLRSPAAGIRRGDQVALASPDGEPGDGVAGGVTAVRAGPDHSTVALVVDNRVHFLPADHSVVIIRKPGESQERGRP